MGQEIERKYLPISDEWKKLRGQGTRYRQGYLSLEPERNVRVRWSDTKAYLTVKGKSNGPARAEFEYEIPPDDADRMLRELCIKPLIEKTRYIVWDGKIKWEVDEFAGENQGLIIAEVETKDDLPIQKPRWIGGEVTDDSRYFNYNLVRHPYATWGGREG
jgi:adenylate cyclase